MLRTASALQPMVDKLSYCHKLDEADRAAILDLPHHLRSVEKFGYLVRERDKAIHCCVMLSGFAIRHKIVGDGGRQVVAMHIRGDVVDLQNSLVNVADHSVQVLTASEVACIPRGAIKELAFERPAVGLAMWFDTVVDASIAREWVSNVGRRDARSRIAHLLCEFSLKLKVAGLGKETDYELPMTQEQLADTVGLTAVHVNRTLKELEKDKLITRSNARGITIGDWRKLAEAGDFDSNYLHLRDDEPALKLASRAA